jgi:hypothetical protein
MAVKARKDMMGVLPDRLDHHQRRVGRDATEYFHSVLLAVDEAVTFVGIAGVAASNVAAQAPYGGADGLLGAGLGRPALLVGGQAQIAAGN